MASGSHGFDVHLSGSSGFPRPPPTHYPIVGTLGGARHVRWAGIQEDYLGQSPAHYSNHFLPPGNADDYPQGLEKEPRGLSGRWYIESGD